MSRFDVDDPRGNGGRCFHPADQADPDDLAADLHLDLTAAD